MMLLRFCCALSPRRCRYVNFEQVQNNRREVAIIKTPLRFYYDNDASTTLLCALGVSATICRILTKLSNRSEIAVQWNVCFKIKMF